MHLLKTIAELRSWRRQQNQVALVPTMGNLHAGHISLCMTARAHADQVVVSIFVNPLQFGEGEDYQTYPRTFDEDWARLEAAGVDALFYPSAEQLYPRGAQQYHVEPSALQHELCGHFRPGHFRGVTTVVSKLFNIVQPDCALFGKKDYQQLKVIEGFVRDLDFPVKIIPVATGRADDGLALSSRNAYLTPDERTEAPRLYRHLDRIRQALLAGIGDYLALTTAASADLTQHGWQVDYVEIREQHGLLPAQAADRALVVLAAARLGRTRLIDNIELSLP